MCIDLNRFKNIKEIYISTEEFWQVNDQSCDFLDLVFDTGEAMLSVEFFKANEDCWIEVAEITELDKEEYKYKIDMSGQVFTLEDVRYLYDGIIDAIKLRCNDVFLFIFTDEYNLILTKSKYDLFEDTGEFFDEEAKLVIVNNV